MHIAVLSRGGAAAKCRILCKYNSHSSVIFAIIRNSCFHKSERWAPWCPSLTMSWRWSFGRSASAAPRKMTRGVTWHPNWMSAHGLPRFRCERCTLSWTQNSSGNPHARIYTPEWPALSLQLMVATYQDVVLCPVPCLCQNTARLAAKRGYDKL